MESASATLLVSSNDPERVTYAGWLRAAGLRVTEAASAGEALDRHQRRFFPLTIAELTGFPGSGADLINAVRRISPEAELLMLSAGDSVTAAVAAMKAGAIDLLVKPLQRQTLLDSIRKIGNLHEVLQENESLRQQLRQRYDFSNIVAHSPHMLRVLALAGRVAPRDTTVLITGESGTGKELLAGALHANSARAGRPMLAINCAAIPETLLESELFGYKRGAFTGAYTDKPGILATAEGGTLFLDEVAELPLGTQAKLLRFLQEGTYFPLGSVSPRNADVRVIAATNAELLERLEQGSFRRDLYYRLSVFPLHIPPLRERPEDIVPLAHHFLREIGKKLGKEVPGLSREVVSHYLTTRCWPGNARELQNAVARAVIVSDGNLLTSADLRLLDPVEAMRSRGTALTDLPEDGVDLPELNRKLVAEAIRRTGYNVSAAARLLGLSRPALRYRLKKYGLDLPLSEDERVED